MLDRNVLVIVVGLIDQKRYLSVFVWPYSQASAAVMNFNDIFLFK